MDTSPPLEPAAETTRCSLGQLLLYFLNLGTFGFGGPIALCGYMQRDLVEKRKWISKEDYTDGLALSQLAPGPLAAQLAMYIGWAHSGILGATLVSFAFILPSFVMVMAISAFYLKYGGISWMLGAFYGIGAAVIAVIVRSSYKLVRLTLGKDWLLWTIFVVNAGITGWKETEIVWVFLASGVLALLIKAFPTKASAAGTAMLAIPPWLIDGLHGPASGKTLWTITWFFTKAGAFVFGSGLAIVPFLYGGVVQEYHWLNERQFLDSVAVAMITPGPVVITVAFVGYLVGGPTGGCLASLGTFLPCYLFVIIPAPFFRKYGKNRHIKAFVDGVTAAATGAIAGAAFVLAKRAIIDWPTALIALVTCVVLFTVKKAPEPLVILAAGVVGWLIRGSG
jgi:chromate transporter